MGKLSQRNDGNICLSWRQNNLRISDLVLGGDIPSNAGFSSSAGIELLMGIILNDIFKIQH